MAIVQGLAAAHSSCIVHRDIKPGNVMLTRDGRAKILDFGLAVAPELTRLTREGRTTGTVSYMSPEHSRGADVDHRTGIWSLGVVLYEMVTRRRPFAGEHEQAVLFSIIHDEPDAPSGVRTGVPLELERIIAKAMAKDPEDRYRHAEDMIVDLRGVARSSTAEAAPAATSEGPAASPLPRGRRGLRTATVVAAAVVTVLAVAWIILKSPWRNSVETTPVGPDRVVVAAFDNR